jgi:hypothetical protein
MKFRRVEFVQATHCQEKIRLLWISLLSLLVALANLICFPTVSAASEIYEFYTGSRQLAMGGTYVAVVNDETALLTNPAGLSKLRDSIVTAVDPEIHGPVTNIDIFNIAEPMKVFGVQSLLDRLNEKKGMHWHNKFQIFPSVVAPNVGFGLLGKYSVDGEVDGAGSNFDLNYTNDYAAVLGFSFRFFGGIVKLGTTFRAVNRVEVHKTLPANSTNLEISGLASEGLGVASDIGLIVSAPVALLPSLAAVLRDAGGTNYNLSDGVLLPSTSERPSRTEQQLDVGLSFQPLLSNRVRMTISVDYHNALTASEEADKNRRLHSGLEINFQDFLFLRAGLNQGYWTGGLELATEKFQLQFATYGEEIGTASAKKQDRRGVLKFALRY